MHGVSRQWPTHIFLLETVATGVDRVNQQETGNHEDIFVDVFASSLDVGRLLCLKVTS
uniref:Uncharacterized protein n=1 Tax=Mesocestoides corti TaxID=53468 RepID=A0A5K3FZ79_MESCO